MVKQFDFDGFALVSNATLQLLQKELQCFLATFGYFTFDIGF